MASTLELKYREFDAKCADFAYRVSSSRKYEKEVCVPGLAERDWQKSRWEALFKEALDLPDQDPVLALLKANFLEFLSGRISGVDTTYAHPARFIGAETRFIDHLARQDSRTAPERFGVLKKRLGQVDAVWEGTRGLLSSVPPDKRMEVATACRVLKKVATGVADQVQRYFSDLSDCDSQDLNGMLKRLAVKAAEWEVEAAGSAQDSVSTGTGARDASGQVDPDRYGHILREELGVSLDDLLKWHETEIEMTRHEMLQAASKLDSSVRTPKDVSDLLFRVAGPSDTVYDMFQRMERYVARAKEVSKQGYVDLPEETCLVSPTPEQTRDDYPWGGYGGGCWRRRPLIGECFLNETNYKAITDGWLKMMAIHECYPGHHAQFVRCVLDPLPATVAMGARSVPLIEGTAHRSEKLLEGIFPDPAFPVFVRLRRHHTAVRIKADLYLHYFGRPVDDAVRLYVDELGFDWNSARGQVRYQERNPGYMTCYYYGMKRLEELQAAYMPDDKEFTRTLFSVGRISLRSLERFLKLEPQDRSRFQTSFKSLLADG